MTEQTTTLENRIRDAADQAGVDRPTMDKAIAETKSFAARAQEVIAEAVDTAVGAVKEHPIAAAGIAAGTAAAVAGAAYGASKLRSGDSDNAAGTSKKKKA